MVYATGWVYEITLGEVLGIIALFFGIAALQLKNGKNILGMQALMNIFWYAHYALAGAYIGALMVAIGFFRNACGFLLPSRYLTKVAVISSVAAITLGLCTAESFIYLSAMCGNVTNNIAATLRDNPVYFRFAQLTAEIFWIIYALTVFSVPAIIFGVFQMSSNIIGFIRHERAFFEGKLALIPVLKD